MTQAEMQATIAKLQAENAALKQSQVAKLKFKRSEKSETVMLTGLRKFPISFYEAEWAKIFSLADAYKAYITANPLSEEERGMLKTIALLNKQPKQSN